MPASDLDPLAVRFDRLRPRLLGVARKLLGSTSTDAEDTVQEAWIRLSRSDVAAIENLEAWLVTTVGRVALNQLRSRSNRREEPWDETPAAKVDESGEVDPEREAVLADSVGVALQVVLELLTPAERLAYVLHDMFGVPFDQVAAVLDRSPDSARQLASRGRRRIRGLHDGAGHTGDPDARSQADQQADQVVVEAFLAAARDGNFEALLAVLDPDVIQQTTTADGRVLRVRGADVVAARAKAFALDGLTVRAAYIDGLPGWAAYRDGHLLTTGCLTIASGRITTMTISLEPADPPPIVPMHPRA